MIFVESLSSPASSCSIGRGFNVILGLKNSNKLLVFCEFEIVVDSEVVALGKTVEGESAFPSLGRSAITFLLAFLDNLPLRLKS